MEAHLSHLRSSIIAALTILRQETATPEARVQDAEAALLAALVYWHEHAAEEVVSHVTDTTSLRGDVETDSLDTFDGFSPEPRHLSAYRQDRGMNLPAFTAFLGIEHHEYAAAVRRRPIDRRLRDQIAYKLDVPWWAIAEFVPKPAPQPRPQLVPLPPRDGAKPPFKPWYLVDTETGQILSGPHTDPLPANAVYLGDPLTWGPTNLVVLRDNSARVEEDQLPPEGYSRDEQDAIYVSWDAIDDAIAADSRVDFDELIHIYGRAQDV